MNIRLLLSLLAFMAATMGRAESPVVNHPPAPALPAEKALTAATAALAAQIPGNNFYCKSLRLQASSGMSPPPTGMAENWEVVFVKPDAVIMIPSSGEYVPNPQATVKLYVDMTGKVTSSPSPMYPVAAPAKP